MTAIAKVTSVVFADDVRREVSGKDILIGVFGGDVMVPALPTPMQIALWVQMDVKGKSVAVEVEITMPNGAPDGVSVRFDLQGEMDGSASISTPPIGTIVTSEGDIVVRFRMADGKDTFTEVARKKIRVAVPSPT
ncbi:hypothetical protein LRP31_18860 [Mesorhizobium mediterraneum]|uniref:Uncharacterized protein n=1 Tax=Mesorhizobium mediterraneum TaxID=43617 RepID=A0AB36RBD2_9HYPH|nr:hypothetical protein [Mesorhizobium mediterraneum]PAQ01547.1 hypothetical protein CIT25_16045 [Mesorhizobium mediterraneum]RWN26414.1 MAG: hypothetical protein EOR96_34235 [Mesorhizobium sp.]WIW51154.1 hypothetical protein LRP31_18860 [Mesorhizobium mediterraneum]